MNADELSNLASDPRFISGIYNYCDRWCERCPFTSRCLNYAMEQAENVSEEERDINNQKFWDHLEGIFKQTIEMIRETASKAGVDLDEPDVHAEVQAKEARLRRAQIKSLPLTKSAMAYGKRVNEWMKTAEPDFKAKGLELETEAQLEIGSPDKVAAAIEDFVEIIRWYQSFIYVKLTRAIGSQERESKETDPELQAFPKDSDGSAKVALIAIDRSIAAWASLRENFTEREDSILDLLRQLGQIRNQTEAMFPNARKFVRPGFDT